MSVDLFASYAAEIRESLQLAQDGIQSIHTLSGAQKRSQIHEAKRHIDEAEETLETINLAVRNADPARKPALAKEADELEKEVSRVRIQLKEAEAPSKLAEDRQALFGNYGDRELDDLSSAGQRSRMESVTSQMEADTDYLRDALGTTYRMKETGAEILGDLESQRGKMLGIRDRFANINDSLSDAGRTMSAMGRKLMANKFIIAGIVLVLLIVIGLVLWLQLR